jgi:hypothetical protein
MQQSQRYRKINIPAAVRRTVWNTYIGEEIGLTECYVGCKTKISQMTFECGHVEAESKGGLTIVDNLRPICSSCNRSMGTRNMHDFMKTFGFKGDIVENNIDNNTEYVCIINKPRREMTILEPSPEASCSLLPSEPITYFIEKCIEYKNGKKISFDDIYQLFDGFCPAFCDKEKVKSISKDMFIEYFVDNFYEVESNMLCGYKFKYEDDNLEDDKETYDDYDEFFDTENDIQESILITN